MSTRKSAEEFGHVPGKIQRFSTSKTLKLFAKDSPKNPAHQPKLSSEILLCAPNALFDYRIPAIVQHRGALYVFFDERPRAAVPNWEEVGGFMPEDLPNPNKIKYLRSARVDKSGARVWDEPRVLSTPQAVCGDAAVVVHDDIVELLYVASETVGYFGSEHEGDRLHLWYGWGRDIDALSYSSLDEVYELLGADGVFATSGSAVMWQGMAAFPLVWRRGSQAFVSVVYVCAGELVKISEPICGGAFNVDETALCVHEGRLYASCRLQGRGGRLTFVSQDGQRFSAAKEFSALDPARAGESSESQLSDPGCNACLVSHKGALILVHPHHSTERAQGSAVRADGTRKVLVEGAFGYSDLVVDSEGAAYLVYERENEIVFKDITAELDEVASLPAQ